MKKNTIMGLALLVAGMAFLGGCNLFSENDEDKVYTDFVMELNFVPDLDAWECALTGAPADSSIIPLMGPLVNGTYEYSSNYSLALSQYHGCVVLHYTIPNPEGPFEYSVWDQAAEAELGRGSIELTEVESADSTKSYAINTEWVPTQQGSGAAGFTYLALDNLVDPPLVSLVVEWAP